MKVIAYEAPYTDSFGDNHGVRVFVVYPVQQSGFRGDPELEEMVRKMTPEEYFDWTVKQSVPAGVTYKVINDSEVPPRDQRANWRL